MNKKMILVITSSLIFMQDTYAAAPKIKKIHHTPLSQRRKLAVNEPVAVKEKNDLVRNIEEAILTGEQGPIEALSKTNQEIFKYTYPDGTTFLHFAAGLNNPETINTLLGKGIDVNAVNKEKRTPLHAAVNNNAIKSIEALLKAGAAINALDENNKTPLDEAYETQNEPVIKFLTERGAKTAKELNAQSAAVVKAQ